MYNGENNMGGSSRRKLLKTIGSTAISLPVLTSQATAGEPKTVAEEIPLNVSDTPVESGTVTIYDDGSVETELEGEFRQNAHEYEVEISSLRNEDGDLTPDHAQAEVTEVRNVPEHAQAPVTNRRNDEARSTGSTVAQSTSGDPEERREDSSGVSIQDHDGTDSGFENYQAQITVSTRDPAWLTLCDLTHVAEWTQSNDSVDWLWRNRRARTWDYGFSTWDLDDTDYATDIYFPDDRGWTGAYAEFSNSNFCDNTFGSGDTEVFTNIDISARPNGNFDYWVAHQTSGCRDSWLSHSILVSGLIDIDELAP